MENISKRTTFLALILTSLLAMSTLSTVTLRQSPQEHKLIPVMVSSQCCQQKGYTECGRINKDCCKDGCITSWLMEFCKGGDEGKLDSQCDNTCIKQCESHDAIMCSYGYIGEQMCCTKENCVGTITECKRDTIIDLGDCIPDSSTESVTNAASGLFSKINPFSGW